MYIDISNICVIFLVLTFFGVVSGVVERIEMEPIFQNIVKESEIQVQSTMLRSYKPPSLFELHSAQSIALEFACSRLNINQGDQCSN